MAPELAFDGVLFPSLLPVFLISALIFWPLETLLTRAGVYRWLWHPSLARLSLFILLFAGLALARGFSGV
ncbi:MULTISPECIES: DUF1656 domain-containing protein [Hydrocarboniphaga]|jgi:hypothetical protein|uniref:DUF1656 domain-containing protein n=1 Tax=Hydrocarboniphaga effusa AP103 TaxID=1172194 RepID=I8T3K6_9GAMM|nr:MULTISPECIES: DUF1656 domain-containing protein [Hydrocarboniphaga]EIT68298.1 hypothetical protein WQQ_34930 [Hydrocarboniphaga effusa AP103]MDZ4078717.1 DUF1656 domain-containing protein [Hydrocarboniphaga sp.]